MEGEGIYRVLPWTTLVLVPYECYLEFLPDEYAQRSTAACLLVTVTRRA